MKNGHLIIRRVLFVTALLFSIGAQAQVAAPAKYLGYELGEKFTPHAQVVGYFKQLAKDNANMILITYGKTYEGRELLAAVISSKENIQRLEEIRQQNLAFTSPTRGALKTNANQPVILWLSYNVHGNEASSTETAMQMAYALLKPEASVTEWLKNTVVIIDPCLNPDGRDRYVNFFNAISGKEPNPDPSAREHNEPWPGGRTNHYYFDLNRDWAWQTQVESQQRLALYQQWMPEVHVDFHEQSYNEPYYFAPAAEPIHEVVTPWQMQFQEIVGKNNARYFDENGWQYFTKERFDLLYPAYGDTYPLYNGSIGMTYEQGGIRAGLAVVTSDGDTLTLKDRISHHLATGLSTLEAASKNAGKLINEFQKFFSNPAISKSGYQSFVIRNDNAYRMKKLAQLLDNNKITYSYGSSRSLIGFNYENGKTESFKPQRNDLIVNMQQSRAILANVLLEPNTKITDTNTYDITAWALPYVFNLPAYAVKEIVKGDYNTVEQPAAAIATNPKPYAWALHWEGLADAKILAALQQAGFRVKLAENSFTSGGHIFEAGTLLIYRSENEKINNANRRITELTTKYGRDVFSIASGTVEKGKDLGSNVYPLLTPPKIVIASGPEVSSQSLGEVWHFLEQELNYPFSMLAVQNLAALDIHKVNVLILPDGNYPDNLAERITPWINAGGKLLLIDDAISAFSGKKSFDILKKSETKSSDSTVKNTLYADRGHDETGDALPGAIFKVYLDSTNPLNFGLGKTYYTLKTDDRIYNSLKNGFTSGSLRNDSYVSGIAGANVRKKLDNGMLFGSQRLGRGRVVYFGANPLFRAFWEGGKQMFLNSLFVVN